MSDENGAKPHFEGGPYLHYCEHPGCNKWGGFGFATGKAKPNWFCFEHRPEWKPRDATSAGGRLNNEHLNS
ncbi:hypothetical protein PYH37_005220 [Sinorhizobium numidicum]|uniref:Molecular chaperone DnaJ n=1 Tax=Sinorhizobium numidicum TaxID=680248 RepID=A0ABY8CY62_9HYPH|nr:hypothetical protein [Sinorhizobium numidicum]WEX76869.1 hypothetical protein PYH37_005220 [Sinorhizobium numidicum]WEX83529.1 hypothetical protein PYH38_002313 [Sinorhizobium numidicum]